MPLTRPSLLNKQEGLVPNNPLTHPEGLFEAPVVGNVLALRHATVDGHVDLLELVAGVLVDDALRGVPELGDRAVVPPLLQVALLVKLSACKGDMNVKFTKDAFLS